MVCPRWRGVISVPNQPLTHPPLPQPLPEGSVDPGWANPSRAGPNSSPLGPPFTACKAGGGKGVSRTPSISSCPGSRGQISCRENIAVLSRRPAFRFYVLSFEFLLTSLLSFFLFSFLVSNEWTGSGLSFVLVWPRDVSVQSHYRLGSVQGLCHAPRSLGIFTRLPFRCFAN